MPSLTVVEPAAPRTAGTAQPLPDRPSTIDGTVVGFREFWPKFDVFTAAFEDLLRRSHDLRGVERVDGTHPRSGPVLERWQTFNRTVDWAISGLGGCGGCAPWAVMDAAELEANGVPTVTLITPDLLGVARRTAETRGWPDLRIVTLPQFLDDLPDEEVRALAADKYDEIVKALLAPVGAW
ncbi:MAG: hypothetical protein AB7H43_02870 [Acidimicrobiia bacterium]